MAWGRRCRGGGAAEALFASQAPAQVWRTFIEKIADPVRVGICRCIQGSTSIPLMRWSEYPWLPCYYAAHVDGIEYRLRQGGIVEIRGTDGHVREYRHWQD